MSFLASGLDVPLRAAVGTAITNFVITTPCGSGSSMRRRLAEELLHSERVARCSVRGFEEAIEFAALVGGDDEAWPLGERTVFGARGWRDPPTAPLRVRYQHTVRCHC